MIVNVRVDHRLLHGQVAMAWNQILGSDCILIANDSVPGDEVRKAGIKLAKPQNTKLVIKNLDFLAKETGMIKSITLGGVKSRENTTQISKAVFVTEDEKSKLKELIESGLEVEIRQVPSDTKIMAKDVI